MIRRTLLACWIALIMSLANQASAQQDIAAPASLDSRPNILLLIAEDMSARVGAFDDPVAITPNLDELARQGVRFPNTFTTAGVCAPSRAALIMGMYQTSFGAHHMRTSSFAGASYLTVPPAEVKAFPELLRAAGYYTYTSNKLDYQFSNVAPNTGPASIWDYEGGAPGWHRRNPGQPFFGMYHFNVTHESRLFTDHPDQTAATSLTTPVMPDQVVVPEIYPDTPTVRAAIAQQYNNIQRMDEQVGNILEQLEHDGLADNTIVIWTTDHGDGLPRFKREIYDTGIKVPMIIRWPQALLPEARDPGEIDGQLISFVDLAPTILSWAGVETPANLQGRPFLNPETDQLDQQRRYIFAAKDRLDEHPSRERAVRGERYKYILNYQPGVPLAQHIAYRDQLVIVQELWQLLDDDQLNEQQGAWFQPSERESLYDTQNDPYEVSNLADDPSYSEILAEMRTALAEWQMSIPDFGEYPEADMAQEFWPDGQQPTTSAPTIELDEDQRIVISSVSEGASIIYRLNDGDWQLYTNPLSISPQTDLAAKSVRYGWSESPEVQFDKVFD